MKYTIATLLFSAAGTLYVWACLHAAGQSVRPGWRRNRRGSRLRRYLEVSKVVRRMK